jgi:hypothetical protein
MTREWFERKVVLEGDGDVSAGPLSSLAVEAEPLAWRHKLTGVIRTDKPAVSMGLHEDYDPLYTHPSSPVSAEVTEAAREAHYREFMADKGHGPDGRTTRQALVDALDAALAALNGKE